MWPFKREKREETPPNPVLRVLVGQDDVCSILASEIPVEKLPAIELRSPEAEITFLDSRGHGRAFSMSSAFAEGARCLHMSVRVGPTFAVQPDGILTATMNDDPDEAYRNGAKALRFQPFLLPESSGRASDLVGRGLFYRGLHFSGTVSPGNLSLMCACDHCTGTFRLQSFHAGFSEITYLYCSDGPHTLVAAANEPDAPPVLGRADADATSRFEGRLPKCSICGGTFRYMNPLLCPHCRRPFIDFGAHPEDRENEYYGNYLYGHDLQRFRSDA